MEYAGFVGFRTILVAYDASSQAEHAVDVALSIAEAMKSRMLVLAVIRPPEPAEIAELNAVLQDGQERFENKFTSIRNRAQENEIELVTDIVVGHPAEQIIHRADSIQASLIVMGRRSH